MANNKKLVCCGAVFVLFVTYSGLVNGSDITKQVFGQSTEGLLLAAFGDFNSDELTDVFMIGDDEKSIEIFLGYDKEPLLRGGMKCKYNNLKVTSVVPGDFDGDAFMDIMFTAKISNDRYNVYVIWGTGTSVNCSNENSPMIKDLIGEPMALDYNKDMVIDLFGWSQDKVRTFYIFKGRDKPEEIKMDLPDGWSSFPDLKIPHSHAYLDLNNDFTSDLFLVTEKNFEIWSGMEQGGFVFNKTYEISLTPFEKSGQSLFLDMELTGNLSQIIPICIDKKCSTSKLFVKSKTNFTDAGVIFEDKDKEAWGFVAENDDQLYSHAITLRGGDFNMDGYPDLLATLTKQKSNSQPQTFLLENVPCVLSCGSLSRTFVVRWNALDPFMNGTVMGAFYDFYQDGILDVLLVEKRNDKKYKTVAFRNTLDYDANFVKVIVLTGLTSKNPNISTPLGHRKKTYGTNLPGPRIEYKTTTQEGLPQKGASAQLPQSAYFSLQLPYTIFGLGRTPNFVDFLTVGLANHSRQWPQVIPNSQMIVVPWPTDEPSRWKMQLFVTPSKLILMSVLTLGVTCLVIMCIILFLYIKEKKEDKLEKLAEAHRFHFDAM